MAQPLFCPRFPKLLYNPTGNTPQVRRARCKTWSCPYCARINTWMWRERSLRHLSSSPRHWSFITLTPHPDTLKRGYSSERRDLESVECMRVGWDKFRKRLRRKIRALEYLRVYENFSKGGVHMHILLPVWWGDLVLAPKKSEEEKSVYYSEWVMKNSEECDMGYITHASNIESNQKFAVFYVTKYVTDGYLKHRSSLKGMRRLQATQGWYKLPEHGSDDWHAIDHLNAASVHLAGGAVTDLDTGEIITTKFFNEQNRRWTGREVSPNKKRADGQTLPD